MTVKQLFAFAVALLLVAGCKGRDAPAVDAGRASVVGPSTGAVARADAGLAAPRNIIASAVRVVPKGELGRFRRGVVASANPIASEEAARILAAGGSAMDPVA